MRVAVYWAPSLDDPLHEAGSAWLGRDAETNAAVRQPPLPGIAEMTADPRRYGLHATLKAPFHIATSYGELLKDASRLASRIAPFDLPPLAVHGFKNFLALRETSRCPNLHALADAAVRELDHHRLPPDAAELARRNRAQLTSGQNAHLDRWGYPFVLEEWWFHMTLTRRLTSAEVMVVLPAAEAHFAAAAPRCRRVEDVSIFTQAALNQPFLIAERLRLTG